MPHSSTVLSLTLSTTRLALDDTTPWSAELGCPLCAGCLGLHQPEPRRPDRLLGVCDACGSWVMVAIHADPSEVALTPLPQHLTGQ